MRKTTLFLCLLLAALMLSGTVSASEGGLDVSMVMYEDSTVPNVLSSLNNGETQENNRYIEYLANNGINISYLWITSSDAYGEKLGMSLSAGDLPDIIPFRSLEQLHQAYEAGYIQDLRGLFDEYASDLLKEIYAYDQNSSFNAVTFDGFQSAIPGIKPAFDNDPMLFIRKDWLDALGIADPATVGDLLAIIRAFSADDPDGNGQNDTYGLAMGSTLDNAFAYALGFFCSYNAYPGCWYVDEDGKVLYGSIEENMKEPLTVLNELYKEGCIDPEFFTKDNNAVLEDIVAGKVGVAYSYSWFPWLSISSHNMDGAQWCCYTITDEDGNLAPVPVLTDIEAYYAVNADFEHPEVLVQMMNSYVENIWGETADAGYWAGSGDTEGLWHLSPVAMLHPMNNFNIMAGIEEMLDNGGNAEGIYAMAVPFYEGVAKYRAGDESMWAYEYVMSPNQYSTNAVNQVVYDGGAYFFRLRAWTQASSDFGDALNQITNTTFANMITGETKIDAFDEMVSQWLQTGGETYINEMQAWYDAT